MSFLKIQIVAAFSMLLAACTGYVPLKKQAETETLYDLVLEADAYAASVSELVWPGLANAPKSFIILEDDTETLVCSDVSGFGFEPLTESPVENCNAAQRARVFPPVMQASLNATGSPETLMTSSSESLGQTRQDWTLKTLHERFHQWQSTLSDYQQKVALLDLADGDESGMWMLMFALPYEDEAINSLLEEQGAALIAALDFRGQPEFALAVRDYADLRATTLSAFSEKERRYIEFQLWKEGVARWVEMSFAREFAVRVDGFEAEPERLDGQMRDEILNPGFSWRQRGVFYGWGAGEVMLLQEALPDWKQHYADEPLSMLGLIDRAVVAVNE